MQKNETTYKPTEEALCVALKEKIITLSKKRPVWSLQTEDKSGLGRTVQNRFCYLPKIMTDFT